jgi:hypothetical protein
MSKSLILSFGCLIALTGCNKSSPQPPKKAEITLVDYPQPTQNPYSSMISLNLEGGKFIQLQDGTLYQIAPTDIDTASVWLTPVLITVTQSKDPNYPYILQNTQNKTQVSAKKASFDDLP